MYKIFRKTLMVLFLFGETVSEPRTEDKKVNSDIL